MNYLQEGESLRSRLDDCLTTARATQNESVKKHYLTEAQVLVGLLQADAAEALVSANLGVTNYNYAEALPAIAGTVEASYFFTEDDVRKALDGGGYGEPGVLIDRLRRVVDEQLAAERASGTDWEGFTPDKVRLLADDPRIDDSAVYDNKGDEPSTRLPTEQFPASDANPSRDFDFETDAKAPVGVTLDDEGAVLAGADLEPEDDIEVPEVALPNDDFVGDEMPPADEEAVDMDDEEEEPDLSDFEPAKTRQAPKKPTTGFEKLQTKTKKKGTK